MFGGKTLKANEWVNKFFAAGEDNTSVLEEFAFETRELVELRTKKSTDKKSKGYATDGALREQRQKWNAICSRIGNGKLKPEMFDSVLTGHLNDINQSQDQWKKKLSAQADEETMVVTPTESEVKQERKGGPVDGRELVTTMLGKG